VISGVGRTAPGGVTRSHFIEAHITPTEALREPERDRRQLKVYLGGPARVPTSEQDRFSFSAHTKSEASGVVGSPLTPGPEMFNYPRRLNRRSYAYMFSLRQTLQELERLPASGDTATAFPQASAYPHGHLPDRFDARKGIRSLFPKEQTLSISSLQNYVFQQRAAQSSGGTTCELFAYADGTGHWLMKILWPAVDYYDTLVAGFVFEHSETHSTYGFLGTSEYTTVSLGFEAFGTDAWIADNWPQVFAKGVRFVLSAYFTSSGQPGDPSAYGIANFVPLAGPGSSELLTPGSYNGTTFFAQGYYESVSGLWGV
jgi:hypothetical protein